MTAGRKTQIEFTVLDTHDLDQDWPTLTHRRTCPRVALRIRVSKGEGVLINHNAVIYEQIVLLKMCRGPRATNTFLEGRMLASPVLEESQS